VLKICRFLLPAATDETDCRDGWLRKKKQLPRYQQRDGPGRGEISEAVAVPKWQRPVELAVQSAPEWSSSADTQGPRKNSRKEIAMATVQKIGFLATSLLMGSLSVSVLAQTPPAGGKPPADNGGGRRNFDPSQFRQRMLDRLKTELGATDDEMQALGPKIEKVMQLQRDASGRGSFFGGSRRSGFGGNSSGGSTATPSANAPKPSDVQQKSSELRTVLENKDAKPEEIKAKLDALRAAKAQAKSQLAAAQAELRGLLTQRQEAVLVENGMLD
jgi:hypothetical protein